MLHSGVGYVRSVGCVSGYRKSKGSLLRRFKLLCSASAVALFFADPGVAGQLPASAFQSYNASAASSIAAGPFALYTVPVNDILPTQANLGFAEIGKKVSAYDLLTPSGLANDLLSGGSIEPVVIGPGGKLYLTNDVTRDERIRLLRSWSIGADQRHGSGLDDFGQRRQGCLRFPDL